MLCLTSCNAQYHNYIIYTVFSYSHTYSALMYVVMHFTFLINLSFKVHLLFMHCQDQSGCSVENTYPLSVSPLIT